jgi:hypothetical protein
MRVTKVDGCCAPLAGEDNMVVTDGFVSVALTSNITEPEEIVVTNANGQTCVRDPGQAEFNGYGVEITFCEVSPCLFSIVTGQPSYLDADGAVAGFRMNSDVNLAGEGFALEVWMGVPGVACTGEGGAFGYLLLPCLQGGVVGDFTIENAAVTFTITGASTKDGNGWGVGPYDVVAGAGGGAAEPLADALDPNDHLLVTFTTVEPPEPTDGCAELVVNIPPAIASVTPNTGPAAGGTSVTISGSNFTGATAVEFDGVAATGVVVNSASSITCTAPAGTAGPADVEVTTPNGTDTLVGGFTYS